MIRVFLKLTCSSIPHTDTTERVAVSSPLSTDTVSQADLVVVASDRYCIDYAATAQNAHSTPDTRNVAVTV